MFQPIQMTKGRLFSSAWRRRCKKEKQIFFLLHFVLFQRQSLTVVQHQCLRETDIIYHKQGRLEIEKGSEKIKTPKIFSFYSQPPKIKRKVKYHRTFAPRDVKLRSTYRPLRAIVRQGNSNHGQILDHSKFSRILIVIGSQWTFGSYQTVFC